jgi:Mrp family chromosome partitioning ATPase
VARYLGINDRRRAGLADVLRDPDHRLDAVVHRLDAFNLSVLPAGVCEIAPYELLDSPRLDALLSEARRDYDWVIVDTPPFVPLPDCRLIERSVDAFVLVVAANKTPRDMVVEAATQLDPDKVIAVVFNADDRRASGYDAYYGYYGSHATQSPQSSRRAVEWRRPFTGDPR